jgi:AcrR family transcriptional regulator
MSSGPQAPFSPRTYDSSGRRARAAEGRLHIVRSAHDLFVAKGFAGTTIADVARTSAVSEPTVYAAFGTKASLLKTCIDVALAGDDEAEAIVDRPLSAWVYDTDDPREVLGRYAVMMGELAARAGPIYDVLVRAADSEPALAELLADMERQRLNAATIVADAVAARGGLPPGRTVKEARDTIWVCNAPELYVTLTRKRRWSTKRYVEWSRNSLLRLVIDPPAPGAVPHR